MPDLAADMTVDPKTVVAQGKAERRQFMRVRVDLSGRLFVPGDGREASCKIVDLSPAGALVTSELLPEDGTPVVLYIDGFGRFEAAVSRHEESYFAVRFHCSALKRERVAEQLANYMNHGKTDVTTLRRHERSEQKGFGRFTRPNGDVVNCEVLDLSLSGLSLKTDGRPPIGEIIQIGQMVGKVVRYHETGIGIEFVTPASDRHSDRHAVGDYRS